jgi:hypothetical protein
MASITLRNSHKNLLFAAQITNDTGASFEESQTGITIQDSPELTIPRYIFDENYVGGYTSGNRDQQWRSLLLNKKGYLKYFGDDEIILTDDPPQKGQTGFLLRFPTSAEKEQAESWAERLGYGSLTEYILAAITSFNQSWTEKAGEAENS